MKTNIQPNVLLLVLTLILTVALIPKSAHADDVTAVATAPVTGNLNWVQSEIGAVKTPGTAIFKDSAFTITGSGVNIWDTTDAFHFVYMPIEGDGSIVARVASFNSIHINAKAGVMLRESLHPNSKQVLTMMSGGNGVSLQYRAETDKVTTGVDGAKFKAPYWVRLDRQGDTITSYNSIDGTKWEQIGSVTVPMTRIIFAGFAVCSRINDRPATAKFDHISMSFHQINKSNQSLPTVK